MFARKVALGGNPVGSVCGCDDGRGYLQIRIDGAIYRAHRLAWLYVHGVWPAQFIDHVNGNRADNRLSNLRDVSRHVNMQNRRGPAADNQLGVLGVMKHREAFVAQIRLEGKSTHIGTFGSAEAAHEAYLVAKRRHHEGCSL